MYGENFVKRSKERCANMTALRTAFEEKTQADQQAFEFLMEEARLRQIEMFRSMKAKYPDSPAVQELCDKELARLEQEETGA